MPLNLRREHQTPWLVFNMKDKIDRETLKLPRPRSGNAGTRVSDGWATDGTKYPVEPTRDVDWFTSREFYAPFFPKADRWLPSSIQSAVSGGGDPADDVEEFSAWGPWRIHPDIRSKINTASDWLREVLSIVEHNWSFSDREQPLPPPPLRLKAYPGTHSSDEAEMMEDIGLGQQNAGPVQGDQDVIRQTVWNARRSCLRIIALVIYLYKKYKKPALDCTLVDVKNREACDFLEGFLRTYKPRGVAFDPIDWVGNDRLQYIINQMTLWRKHEVPIAYVWWPEYASNRALDPFNPEKSEGRYYIENQGTLPKRTFLVANRYHDQHAYPFVDREKALYEATCFSEVYESQHEKINMQVSILRTTSFCFHAHPYFLV